LIIVSISLRWGIVVKRIEKSNVLKVLKGERDLDCMYSNISLKFSININKLQIFVFQPKMKNCIYRHFTGFLNYRSVLTNSVILLALPNDHSSINLSFSLEWGIVV
jgi:hypothetical protein